MTSAPKFLDVRHQSSLDWRFMGKEKLLTEAHGANQLCTILRSKKILRLENLNTS
jgi:hypothetical protein